MSMSSIARTTMLKYLMIQKTNSLVFIFLILLGQYAFTQNQINIASFNLRIFGQAKAEKEPVIKAIASILQQFDLVAVQEIRDKDENAILKLMDAVNILPEKYGFIVGPRLGRTSSKEQYAFIYKLNSLKYDYAPMTWNDEEHDIFEREPFAVNFYVVEGNLDFVIVNIHTKPEDADAEIRQLTRVMEFAAEYYGEEDVICLGDFNADGSYFKEEEYLSVFPEEKYIWIIPNEADTNVAKSDMTYDRIVATRSMDEDYLLNWGILRFDEIDLNESMNVKVLDISDHYPVWASFSTENDTD